MKNAKKIQAPLSSETVSALKAGDKVLLTGTIYTARDQAHLRFTELISRKEGLPVNLDGQVIYYCGPSPAPPGRPIGAAGPTTSYRMDPFTPELHRLGIKGTIGKGNRSARVRTALRSYLGVYFVATGGAGALLAQAIKDAEVVAYPELGPEAIRLLQVEDFPVIVGYDAHGGSAFEGEQSLSGGEPA